MVRNVSSKVRSAAEWRKLLRLLPGYDPYRDAKGYKFDPVCAQMWLDFFQHPRDGCLRHIEGALAGKLFKLEPWQESFIANLFGWKVRGKPGVRRYRSAFLFVPRKNGKTPMCAGICVGVMAMDGEAGAQVYSAAAEKEQAALLFRHARGMVDQEPVLGVRMRVYGGTGHRSIVNREDQASVYKVLSADAKTKHGLNGHLAIIDELHAQPNRELVDVLETSLTSKNRVQPLIVYLTTSDFDREDSICNEKHAYFSKVRDGIIDNPRALPAIWEATLEDDWTDPKVWAKANPNLDVSVSLDSLEELCQQAKDSPAFENTFKRLHLNIRTEAEARLFTMGVWDACDKGSIDEEALIGRPCWGGLDLGATSDVTAFTLVFPDDSGVCDVKTWYWMPEAARHKDKNKNYVKWGQWHREGLVTLTEGNVTDYAVVRRDINALADRGFRIEEIAVDRLFQGAQLLTDLNADGFTAFPFGQGFMSMAGPSKGFHELLLDGKINHGGDVILRWMASNVMFEIDPAGNMKPSKKKRWQKIDGIVTLIMALGRAMVREDTSSVYDHGGLISV